MIAALELLVLAVAPWPLYRALTLPPFWRSHRCFAGCSLVLLLLYAAAVVGLALYLPGLLHAAAVFALAMLGWERWRARSDYGKARGLPPGSLALVPRAPWLDHRFYLEQARRHGPVFKVSLFIRPMVGVVGGALGRELLQNHGAALRSPPTRFNRSVPGGFLRYMEGDTHARYRRIVQTGFAPAVLEQCDRDITTIVRAALAGIAQAGDGGVSPRAALSEMLLAILLRLFFGITQESDVFHRLQVRYDQIHLHKSICYSARRQRKVAAEIA